MNNSMPSKKRVFVAMSGGVDSSVAAYLLKKQGYDVVGVFMRCWSGASAGLSACSTEQDATDARLVAEKLKIPFYVWDFKEEYKKRVVDYMISGYRKGITPNPDVMCNKEIKFGLFLEKALEMEADYIATGHYVKKCDSKPRMHTNLRKYTRNSFVDSNKFVVSHRLYQAKDKNKDQSYFLWTLTQEQLKHCLFPIGNYLKSEVREIARKAGLPTAEKKDSQGICFLGKVTLNEFLKQYIPAKRGKVLSANGKVLGEHQGAHFYTIGQRHIGISNQASITRGAHEVKPVYVAEKDVKTNILVMAEGGNNPALYKKEIELVGVNFINPITNYQLPIIVYARVRYRQPLAGATFYKLTAKSYKLLFEKPQKAVALGQSAVFYSKDGEMLGGGVIKMV